MCTKDLNTPARKIKTFCGTDILFLCNGMKCPTRVACCCEAFHPVQSGHRNWGWLWKDLHSQSGVIFPACSLEIGLSDRIYVEWGGARPKPLLWIQREKCLSSNLILPKSFIMWVFLNFLVKLKASRIFWHFPFFKKNGAMYLLVR